MKVNGGMYGGSAKTTKITAETTIFTHNLIVRGGKLVSIDDIAIDSISNELKDVISKMGLIGDNAVLNVLENGKGSNLTESNIAALGNAVRGTNDLASGKPWYFEDTTELVIREYTHIFPLPTSQMYINKIPMSIKGLEAPVD